MPSWEKLSFLSGAYGPIVLVVIAVFLALETAFRTVARRRRERGEINTRLKVMARTADREAALVELRRRRGLTAEGGYRLPLVAFNRLFMQSGASIFLERLGLLMTAAGTVAAVLIYTLTYSLAFAGLGAAGAGIVLPMFALVLMRARRLKRLEEQLPEAVDVMVRSLRAGHPIPVAVSLVAREMPDPIGTEFGMASDEMTYGMDLETTMSNMRARAGQSDLGMLVVAVSIQSKTGGNLAEILANLSRMIRERAKLRRKVHSLSSEGRFSAIALSVIPVGIYVIVTLTAPTFYSEVRGDPLYTGAVYLGFALWVTGMFVMRRMVHFKF